jgi:hypothetical protein
MSSQAEIQEKISAARREADGLKDKIRAAKEQTADTSCERRVLLGLTSLVFVRTCVLTRQCVPWQMISHHSPG